MLPSDGRFVSAETATAGNEGSAPTPAPASAANAWGRARGVRAGRGSEGAAGVGRRAAGGELVSRWCKPSLGGR